MFGSRKDSDKKKGGFWSSLFGRSNKEEAIVETPEQSNESAPIAEAPQQTVVETVVPEPVVEETIEPAIETVPVAEVEEEIVEKSVVEETIEPIVETTSAVEIEDAVVEATIEPIVEIAQVVEEVVEPIIAAAPIVEAEEVVVETVEPIIEAAPIVEVVEAVVEKPVVENIVEPAPVEPKPVEQEKPAATGFFARMRQGLTKTRSVLVEGIADIFIGKKEIDENLLDELETQLLVADVGVEATSAIISSLTAKVKYKELSDSDALMAALQSELAAILEPADQPLVIPKQDTPFVILVVGVNGVGKTTTIGKLAKKFQQEGRKVMLAAGDTFRAAAVEQLQIWGERNNVPVVAQRTGADSASVVFDAFESARAKNIDVLIADTAGRLHNKDHLMDELRKVKRVLSKLDPTAPHEVLLVLDAGTGQNALNQARIFNDAVQLSGIALTKLDGTAKGGVIFALSKQTQLPIRFLGVGEQIDDLRPFSATEFVEALFDKDVLNQER